MLAMLVSAVLGSKLRPTVSVADKLPTMNLKAMVPTSFGDWHEELNAGSLIVDPQRQATLERIYSETLSRVYVNSSSYRIMLSIAYGKNQSGDLQLHKPEVCYPAQGFEVRQVRLGTLALQDRSVPAVRLETNQGQRFEPVTYWAVVGDTVTSSVTNKRITEVRYAMRGLIPDGMLVRVSSIDRDESRAHSVQDQFSKELIAAIAPQNRARFAGEQLSN
jgi:EpsI family protein